jgi:hypothetical protein
VAVYFELILVVSSNLWEWLIAFSSLIITDIDSIARVIIVTHRSFRWSLSPFTCHFIYHWFGPQPTPRSLTRSVSRPFVSQSSTRSWLQCSIDLLLNLVQVIRCDLLLATNLMLRKLLDQVVVHHRSVPIMYFLSNRLYEFIPLFLLWLLGHLG